MLPETPAWLASRDRTDEAKEALLWLRGPGFNVDKEYQELRDANAKRKKKEESLLRALHKPNVWKPFLILLVFFALQQLSGIYVILFYAVNVLEDIGVDVNEYAASVGMGVIRLFASILGAGLANTFGRKCLAFVSGFGMAIAAMGVALSSRFAFSIFSNNQLLSSISLYLNYTRDLIFSNVFFVLFCLFIIFSFLENSSDPWRYNIFAVIFQVRTSIVATAALHRDPCGRIHDRFPHVTVGHDLGVVPVKIQGQFGRSYDQHRAGTDVRHDKNVSGSECRCRSGDYDVDIQRGRSLRRHLRANDIAGDSRTQS